MEIARFPFPCMCVVLQEAVSTGDPELVQLVLQYRDFRRATERLAGIPELLSKLRQVKLTQTLGIQAHHLDRSWSPFCALYHRLGISTWKWSGSLQVGVSPRPAHDSPQHWLLHRYTAGTHMHTNPMILCVWVGLGCWCYPFQHPSSGQLLWCRALKDLCFLFCFLSQCLWCRKYVRVTCTVCGRVARVYAWIPPYWGLSTWPGSRAAAATSLRVEVSEWI